MTKPPRSAAETALIMRINVATSINGDSPNYDRNLVFGSILAAIAACFCIHFLDESVSLLVTHYLYRNGLWARHTLSLPDLLLITVLFTTAATYSLFRHRASRGIVDLTTLTCKLLAIVAPLSYIVKSVLKFVFGRINTREWLLTPEQYGFHWFQGGGNFSGFPSGHMLVFTALTAVMWRLHPGYRRGFFAFLLAMALALIATNYHFVSDVLAGACLGFLIEVCVWRIVTGHDQFRQFAK